VGHSQGPLPVDDEDPIGRRSQRLLATDLYDVWLTTWPDGSGEAYHGYGGVRGVLQVIDGELIEVFSDDTNELAPGARVLRRGDVISAKPSFAHDLTNRSGADATTIHVFSPPLRECNAVDPPTTSESERLRTGAVSRRFRQTSSHKEPALRPPPLALVHPSGPTAGHRLTWGDVAPSDPIGPAAARR
jgi:hypothetical protein